MISHIRRALLLTVVTLFASDVSAQTSLPTGWFAAGNRPADYNMSLESSTPSSERSVFRMSSKTRNAPGFGTLMQSISADEYRGKRIRFSGRIRTANVSSWASLWVRVDGPCTHRRAFDNGQTRGMKGTAEWRDFHVVVDVASDAEGISFGQLLNGPGTAWFSNLAFSVVPNSTPSTAMRDGDARSCGPRRPQNLEFRR